ncbi:MAG: hypothetical protein AAGF11_00315 [Myxococcota bacterium]
MSEASARTLTAAGDANPFVGPRPIQQGEDLHGRSVEIDALYDRLQARRIVVLHSPSGAGKSSLVQAGLVPRLRGGRFDVWKPIRVNLDPTGLEDIPSGTNRYLLSAMVSLEEELPSERRRTPAQLAELDLLEYLESRPRRKGRKNRSVVLLFDQFEEVITMAPLAVAAKQEFFSAVGRALDTEKYWALFIIREDYLATLAPYRDRIPTGLTNTFRLDLLGLAGAREAAEQLALSGGRTFPAVDQLVRDLSMIQVQRSDGTIAAEPGLHVEPVQLQVVCRRLWDAMPRDDLSIDEEDIEAYAQVSTSLRGYYADAIRTIAGPDTALERSLRDWVGQRLIVGGRRSQVRQDVGSTMGLDNTLLDRLLDTYLVRIEQRAGAGWFELSHDRLVDPVLEDNEAWEQAHLHPLQVQAKLWEDGGRAPALLLGAAALPDARRWAQDNPHLLTEGEQEFLALSRTLREEEARQRRRQRIFTITVAIAAVVAIALGGVALAKAREAEQRRQQAVDSQQAAESAQHEAESARNKAVHSEQEAVAARDKAEQAQRKAEQAQKENERLVRDLLRQMFQVALSRSIESLAAEGLISGEIEVDERWTPLLERKGQRFAAANVVPGGGRIVAAGHDAVLSEVDDNGDSLFLEITLEWLLGDQARRGVVVISQQPQTYPRLEKLRRNLSALGYEYEIDPPLTDPQRLAQTGAVIVANRGWKGFSAEEIAAVEAFAGRGGGLLAVGGGWSWLEGAPAEGQAAPTLDNYPMNELMRGFGVRWNGETIDPEQLDKAEERATVKLENASPHTVDVFRSSEGRDEYYTTLSPGEGLEVRTAVGHQWVVRRVPDDVVIGSLTIQQRAQHVVIGETLVRKTPRQAPKASPKPEPAPSTQALPKTLSKAAMQPALSAAQKTSRICGTEHGSLMPSVKVKFEVRPNGKVKSANALAPMKGTPVGICAADAVLSQRFPKSQQGVSVTWNLPL